MKEELHYRIKFDLNRIPKGKLMVLYSVESLLSDMGIEFDTGSDRKSRYWEWDWSLKGPVSIESRTPTPYDSVKDDQAQDSA